jgi:hypothetical protein
LGYGKWTEEPEPDELDDSTLDAVSLAARRFDDMIKRLRFE